MLPNALMIGVDYELFWTLNPRSLSPFIKAFNLKQKYDDAILWHLGGYIKMAIASSFSKDAKYPNKPVLSDMDTTPKKKEETEKVMSPEEIKQRMLDKMKQFNPRLGKEE